MPAEHEQVDLQLSSDEALVLFDWLHRCEDDGEFRQPEHRGKKVALWNLSATLERMLLQPFQHDYLHLVRAARSRLAGEEPLPKEA
jgi:hypothetical protein